MKNKEQRTKNKEQRTKNKGIADYSEVELSHVDSVFSYAPIFRGQCAYIHYRCRQEGIGVVHRNGRIVLSNKEDLKSLDSIVLDSLTVKGTAETLQESSKAFCEGRVVLCVMLRDLDLTFIPESKVDEIVRLQFLGRIPSTMNYRIFSRLREMRETLLDYKLII